MARGFSPITFFQYTPKGYWDAISTRGMVC